MANEKFTIDESMSMGWKLLSDNFWVYAGLASLAYFLMFLPDMAGLVVGFDSNLSFIAVILMLLGAILKCIVPMGLYNVQIRLVNGLPASSDDLWSPAPQFLSFLIASVIYAWVVGCGILFLVVPGIIFGIMFQFYPYFIVEYRLGPIQALKASAAITAGAMWELFLLGVLIAIIQMLSGIAFIFGIIPAEIFKQLTMTAVYRVLLNRTPADQLPFPYDTATGKMRTDSSALDAATNKIVFDKSRAGGKLNVPPDDSRVTVPAGNSEDGHQSQLSVHSEVDSSAVPSPGTSPPGIDSSAESRQQQPDGTPQNKTPHQPDDTLQRPDHAQSETSATDSALPVDNSSGENDKTL